MGGCSPSTCQIDDSTLTLCTKDITWPAVPGLTDSTNRKDYPAAGTEGEWGDFHFPGQDTPCHDGDQSPCPRLGEQSPGLRPTLGRIEPVVRRPMEATTRRVYDPNGWLRGVGGVPIPRHTGIYKLHLEAQATLRTAAIRESVFKPPGVGKDEWFAAQTVGLFGEILTLTSAMGTICNERTCPKMSAGPHVSYAWTDWNNPVAKELCAHDYMIALVNWAHKIIGDGTRVPQTGGPFPKTWQEDVRMMHKRFFRVYAHVYLHHFDEIRDLGAEAHLNYLFKHWMYFVREFDLVADADMAPLQDLIRKFEAAAGERPEIPIFALFAKSYPDLAD